MGMYIVRSSQSVSIGHNHLNLLNSVSALRYRIIWK